MTSGSPLDLGGSEHVLLQTSGGPIAARVAGPPTARPALLVPGYTGSKEDFGPLFEPLAGSGFRVTAIDLPGQYESPGPADPAAYTSESLGATVREIAAALGPRVHLLGHSFGGLVARAAVLADPDLFASLVLMDSGPGAIGGARRDMIERLAPVLAASGLAAVYAASQAAAAGQTGYVAPPPPLAAFLERRFLAGVPAMLRGMGDTLRTEPDRVAELADLDLPVLVLHGADDDAWPPVIQQDMARRLGAPLVVVAGAAHSPAVENPEATAASLIDFWRDADRRAPEEPAGGSEIAAR